MEYVKSPPLSDVIHAFAMKVTFRIALVTRTTEIRRPLTEISLG